ncbi:hypothetical protein [Vibrio gigantis]|uniref:hypothetical protein n=1 Tax=Vibrio gigantis TaxID=296199 RepID=UPI001BFE37A5|nr:hypothetical protein [Vibrio gigantis]
MTISERLVDDFTSYTTASSELQALQLSSLFEQEVFTQLPFKEPEEDRASEPVCDFDLMQLEALFLRSSTSIHFETEHSSIYEYDTLVDHHPWVKQFYSSSKCLTTVTEVSAVYKDITELLQEGKTYECDTFLKFVEPKDLSNVLLVGLLRLTNSYKSKLRSWSPLKTKVTEELYIRGYDPIRKLRGL